MTMDFAGITWFKGFNADRFIAPVSKRLKVAIKVFYKSRTLGAT
jgi:hypothetical protein